MKNFRYYLEMVENTPPSGTFTQKEIKKKGVDTAYKFSFNLNYNGKNYQFEIDQFHDFWPDNEQVISAIWKLPLSEGEKEEIDEYIENHTDGWQGVFTTEKEVFYPKHLQKVKKST